MRQQEVPKPISLGTEIARIEKDKNHCFRVMMCIKITWVATDKLFGKDIKANTLSSDMSLASIKLTQENVLMNSVDNTSIVAATGVVAQLRLPQFVYHFSSPP